MNAFFLELLNMSFVASLLILAVILVRLVFRKAPKAIICVLWALVGLRLICPFSLESPLSLVPDAQPVTYIAEQSANSDAVRELEKVTRSVVSYDAPDGSVVVTTKESVNFDYIGFLIDALPFIWLGGVALMAVSSVISYIRLRQRILVRVNKEDNIWRCDGIKSPFILGVIKPKIYIPSHLSEAEQAVVIAHEKAHLKRLDHLWKPLGYVILAVHWFNPLVWAAYALLCRDIEGACDEHVVKKMSGEDKKLYSETLLSCSAPRHMLTACPVAFGEVSVKGRVKSVLNYKKPAFWIIIASLLVVTAVAVLFMTNPIKKQTSSFETSEELIHHVIMSQEESKLTKEHFAAESHMILGSEETRGGNTAYYIWVDYGEFSEEDGELIHESGGLYPAAVTVKEMPDGKFELVEYWEPEDGEGYSDSIKEKFPSHLYNRVLYGTSHESLTEDVEKLAMEHFGITEDKGAVGEYPRFAGEILEVTDEHYLVAPLEYETVMGQSYEKIYVSRGVEGDAGFIKGDMITVYYAESMEDSDPPCIAAESISLCSKVFHRIEPQNVEFYRTYTLQDTKAYASLDVSEEELENIKVYRYMPETPLPPEEIPKDATYSYNDPFAPYIYLDYNKGYATFAYSSDYSIVGLFDVRDGKLVINGFTYSTYYPYVNNQDGDVYVFEPAAEGYAFDKESSDPLEPYSYEFGDEVYDSLPDGAIFKDDFNLEVKYWK